ncbi:MAG: DsbE family thiol:disulfide interchange protein [Alphaproteobacteria bacterium]|nr:DsbE family thiol:disulfide interchange protein [Alphaproteobacteria bacterium]
MARLIYILPLFLFFGLAAYFAAPILQGKDPHTLPSAMIDKPSPAKILPPLIASKPGIDPASLTGEVQLVNFFASWCGPCRAEHTLLMEIGENKAVPLYGVNYKDRPSAAVNWLAQLGDPFERIGRDSDGRVAIDWGVYGVPETYVVDKAGRIQYRHVGPLSREAFEGTIMPLVTKLREAAG